MNLTHWKYVVIVALALLAISVFAGHPLISPDAVAGLGMLPFMLGETASEGAILSELKKQGKEFEDARAIQSERLSTVEKEIFALSKKSGRPFAPGDTPSSSQNHTDQFIDGKSGKSVRVLTHGDKMAALGQKAEGMPSMGRFLRGIILGGRAPDASELTQERKALLIGSDPSGGFTVTGALSNEWIDALRADMVLSKAGARTVPMDSASLSLSRVVTSPTISWHGENVALPEADPTFGLVTLNAKTCVCLVKISLELSQDSANIEQILQQTIISSMAAAIDSAGLNGVTTDAGAAPAGVFNLADRNTVLSIGAPTSWDWLVDGQYELMLDNVPMESIGALIAHPAVYKKMRKLKTGIASDNTSLSMPAEIAALPKLWTTAAPLTGSTAKGIIADWRDLIFGVRQDITVRVLSETYMGSNLQIAVLAYARVDFAATRQTSFCTLEGITV